MKRIAAHKVCFAPQFIYHTSYAELSDDNKLLGVYPLQDEIAGTRFVNGAVLLVPERQYPSGCELESEIARIINSRERLPLTALLDGLGLFAPPAAGERCHILHLSGLNLSSSEFGANNGGSDRYVQRL